MAGAAEILDEVALPEPTAELVNPVASAEAVGLNYVSDMQPGIRRREGSDPPVYIGPDGRPVRDETTLARIRSLAIPPAYADVWICPDPNGHLQATGRDAKGRKQYRYHPRWRAVRDMLKYDRMIAFAEALPAIRERTAADLARPGMSREKVLAIVVRLLEETLIRVGNDEYRKQNKSFGLTTLRDRHVAVEGATVRFAFRGKSGKDHEIELRDRRLARLIKRCQEIPGQELFQYLDEEGKRHAIGSADVNAYLREISGEDFTAKDFRTWAGTCLAATLLRLCEPCASLSQSKGQVTQIIKQVAARLGNTPAICRKCYVHPAVLEAYLNGELSPPPDVSGAVEPPALPYALSGEEQSLLDFLRAKMQAAAEQTSTPPEQQSDGQQRRQRRGGS